MPDELSRHRRGAPSAFKEQMQEFQRAVDMGRYQGMDLEMMSNDDLKKAYPFMETHDLAGGMWDPMDDDVIRRSSHKRWQKAHAIWVQKSYASAVEGVERIGDEWEVSTPQGKSAVNMWSMPQVIMRVKWAKCLAAMCP